METHPCPKCNEPMDEGYVSVTGSGFYGYVSRKQTGMLKSVTKINMAHVCLSCGYVDLYLGPNELKKKLR
jgi:predicted nucleic-acid-binding Zn-ribbon protein